MDICAVVKANAYGHGLKLAEYIDEYVDCFAVATIDEASSLSKLSVTKDILILGAADRDISLCNNRFVHTIASVEDAHLIANRGNERVHIKINTGMNRLGVSYIELDEVLSIIDNSSLVLEGIFTHFACGDNLKATINQFDELNKCIINYDLGHLKVHCCASNILNYSEYLHMGDMARIGIAMYGYHNNMTPALKLYTQVVKVNKVSKREGVGYDYNYKAIRDMTTATIRLGYGDGYMRAGSGGYVVVHGQRAKIVGNICMDMCMIDISSIGKVSVGDRVYIICDEMSADCIADNCGTIAYEILTNLSERVKRIYINE